MELDKIKAAQEVAADLDAGRKGEVDKKITSFVQQINSENKDPEAARLARREFIKTIDKYEENGKGDDLTIKYDQDKVPKHYTVMSAEMNASAKSIAAKLDAGKGGEAAEEFAQVLKDKGLKKGDRDLGLFILTLDAYEKDGKGHKDDVEIEYGPGGKPTGQFRINFPIGNKGVKVWEA